MDKISYEWIKAFHIISVISWMAGMLYLPRLFVYHTTAQIGSELSETLKIMEQRLLRYIMTPAMIATFVFGVWMLMLNPGLMDASFMRAKLFLVILMAAMHGFLAKCRKDFSADRNSRSVKFYRAINEIPTFLMIGIVVLIIVKPTL